MGEADRPLDMDLNGEVFHHDSVSDCPERMAGEASGGDVLAHWLQIPASRTTPTVNKARSTLHCVMGWRMPKLPRARPWS